MHILIHDYAGHPAPIELSRTLAAMGHRVTHAFFHADPGPKGRLTRTSGDPARLDFRAVEIAGGYSKTDFFKRRAGDISYGRALATLIADEHPDVVISGNTPTEAQERPLSTCRDLQIPFVYWCQDFYSIAASRLLGRKLPGLGHAIGAYYRFLERRQMIRSTTVLHITEAFRSQTRAWGIPSAQVQVIPNWGSIADLPVLPRNTAWAREQGINDCARFLYSGTLAMKHNPAHLTALADALENRGDSQDQVILVASGVGAAHIPSSPALRKLPLQPIERFAEVLASGDVLLALIERDAGTFSVPSKVLSYLCAGRPIVLAAPKDNLAAQIVASIGAGVVVEPEDTQGFVAAALSYCADSERAAKAGAAGRAYAEQTFGINAVARTFEGMFQQAIAAEHMRHQRPFVAPVAAGSEGTPSSVRGAVG